MEDLTELEHKIVGISALIGVDKDNSENFTDRSELFYKCKLYRQALEDAKAALKLDPKCLRANIAAGKASMKLKRFDECYHFYKDGLVLDSNNSVITEDLKALQNSIMDEYDCKGKSTIENAYSALKLCSQDIYPGDDELFKLELEILQKKYKVSTTATIKPMITDLKRRKEAATLGVMAHNCRESAQLQEALHYCTAALEKDDTNHRLLQMRAEVFRDMGDDRYAVQDLYHIPKPNRSPDVWKMGGIILSKFELPVMAEFWLRKATTLVPDKDTEAAALFQKIRVKRIYSPLTTNFSVEVVFTEYGRAIVATDNLQAGYNAFDDIPLVVGQLIKCLHLPACGHCGASLISQKHYFGNVYDKLPNNLKSLVDEQWPDVTGVMCGRCNREKYCSATCRDEAWERYHQIICPSKNTAASELYDLIDDKGFGLSNKGLKEEIWQGQYSPIILAKIWGIIIAEAKRQMRQAGLTSPTPEQWARAKMPFRKFISFGSIPAVKKIPEIFSLMQRIFIDCGDNISYNITEAEFEARYYQATCNLQAFSASVTPHQSFIDSITNLEDMRVLGLLKYLDRKPPVVSFAGMFSLHACLNHACDNNVEVMDGFADGKPAVHIRVRRDIKPGEELYTTYIDTAMPRKLRRALLFRSFNFWCFCKRCQFEGDDNSMCTNCNKEASKDKRFPGCGRCKKAWYCSTKCQKESWVKGHKAICQMDHTSIHMQVSENNQ